jgi:metacaspase-1
MTAKAVVVGINKFKNFPQSSLNGCVNDSENMVVLFKKFGLEEKDITVLQDSKATKANILEAIVDALNTKPEKFFYSVSSHGSYVTSKDNDEELDECTICYNTTSNFDNVIVDDEYYDIFKQYPDIKIECFVDTCHAGTVLRAADLKKMFLGIVPYDVPRFIPNKKALSSKKAYTKSNKKSLYTKEYKNVVLWAACKDTETASDAYIDGVYEGAFTHYLTYNFKNTRRLCLYRRQFKEITLEYDQVPQLECSWKNKLKRIF